MYRECSKTDGMNPDRSSFVPIQQKMDQQKALQDSSRKSSRSCIWDDMQGWMEQRQREWDDEMTQLKSEFFSMKSSDKLTSRRSSSDASSLPERTSIASRSYDTGRGCKMFCVTFDVSQFEPEEVNVRTQANSLIVHAKHEEQRENKSVSREFNRRVDIPSHINPDTLRCFMRDDGTLQVEAELPSPSYESSSVNRDSPFALENSSTFSDRLSDRDMCSPPRTDRDMCSPPGIERDIYSPPETYRDIYSPPRRVGDLYSPFGSHWTNDGPPIDGMDSYSYQKTDGNIYNLQTTDKLQQSARDIYSPTQIDNDIYNPQRIARDILSPTTIDRTSCNLPTLHHESIPDGGRPRCPASTDVMARNSQAMPIASQNGHTDEGDVFSVVIDIGTGFEPDELAVQAVDRKLVVHARHTDQRSMYGGDIYREFDLPEGVDPGSITANLTPEGTLIIEAPTTIRPCTAESINHPYPHNFSRNMHI